MKLRFALPNPARLLNDAMDKLFPAMGYASHERSIYLYLLHRTLAARRPVRALRITRPALADAVSLSAQTARNYLRILSGDLCLCIAERSDRGMDLEVFSPREILRRRRAAGLPARVDRDEARQRRMSRQFRDDQLKQECYRRERGRCFYCLRRLVKDEWSLDHVVPVARGGDNRRENAAACCLGCNQRKADLPAPVFLKLLRHERRLTAAQYAARRRTLRTLFPRRARKVVTVGWS
jgi:5-methylcytosine-specific restriction endonuclease McrA